MNDIYRQPLDMVQNLERQGVYPVTLQSSTDEPPALQKDWNKPQKQNQDGNETSVRYGLHHHHQ